jgi:hypothetical protein
MSPVGQLLLLRGMQDSMAASVAAGTSLLLLPLKMQHSRVLGSCHKRSQRLLGLQQLAVAVWMQQLQQGWSSVLVVLVVCVLRART